jgi:hypothetical protein
MAIMGSAFSLGFAPDRARSAAPIVLDPAEVVAAAAVFPASVHHHGRGHYEHPELLVVPAPEWVRSVELEIRRFGRNLQRTLKDLDARQQTALRHLPRQSPE